MRKRLILGRPGTGKTEKLLRIIENAIAAGARPDRIALSSFTNAAIDVAKARACEAFGLVPDDLPNFRTTHSFAFRELGLRRGDVLSDEHLDAVAEVTGELLSTLESPFSDAPAAGKAAGRARPRQDSDPGRPSHFLASARAGPAASVAASPRQS